MSYSFNIRAATKTAAKAAVAIKMAEVVSNQPSHALDQAQALATANAFIDLLPDNEAMDLSVSVNGSVGWTGSYGGDHVFTAASIGVSAYFVTKEAAAV
jgi:hypothetical protein